MKDYVFHPKLLGSSLNLAVAFLWLSLAHPIAAAQQQQEQQSSSSQQQTQQSSQQQPQNPSSPSQPTSTPQPPPAKQKKVWTNDDVLSLRTPEDLYRIQKEADEAAAAEAAAKEAAAEKLVKEAGLTMALPETAEETQQWIRSKQTLIAEDQSTLDRLNGELPQTPPDRLPDMQKEIDRVSAELSKARLELKVLQNHLLKLTKPPAPETSTAPPTPPSP